MENDGEAGQSLRYLLEDVKAKLGIGAGFELVSAVAGPDGDGQGIHAGLVHKLFHLFGPCVGGILRTDLHVVLDAGQGAKFCLNHHALVMGILGDFLRQGDVLLEGLGRAVDHDGGESAVDAGFADLKICTVVQMQGNGKLRINVESRLDQAL